MSLCIGVRVKKQSEAYGDEGKNPAGTETDIANRFASHLRRQLPKGGFGGAGLFVDGDEYDFDVQVYGYGDDLKANGYTQDDLYLAILGFVLREFSVVHGIEIRAYWAG